MIELIKFNYYTAEIEVSKKDLILFRNSLAVICEEINDWEYPIRLGAEIEETQKLISEIDAVIAQLE